MQQLQVQMLIDGDNIDIEVMELQKHGDMD
jgi:hypothetical protein